MKKFIILSLFFISFVFLISSCTNNTNVSQNNPPMENTGLVSTGAIITTGSWVPMKNPLLDNKEYTDFMKLSKEQILSYDCNKFNTEIVTARIGRLVDLKKSCENRKISTQIQSLKNEEILKLDCSQKYSQADDIGLCQRVKISRYITNQKLTIEERKNFDCSVFQWDDNKVCQNTIDNFKKKQESLKWGTSAK